MTVSGGPVNHETHERRRLGQAEHRESRAKGVGIKTRRPYRSQDPSSRQKQRHTITTSSSSTLQHVPRGACTNRQYRAPLRTDRVHGADPMLPSIPERAVYRSHLRKRELLQGQHAYENTQSGSLCHGGLVNGTEHPLALSHNGQFAT